MLMRVTQFVTTTFLKTFETTVFTMSMLWKSQEINYKSHAVKLSQHFFKSSPIPRIKYLGIILGVKELEQ